MVFVNNRDEAVKLFWIDTKSNRKLYSEIAAGKLKRQRTRPGAVWMIADKNDQPLGHFVVDDRTAKATVPPK